MKLRTYRITYTDAQGEQHETTVYGKTLSAVHDKFLRQNPDVTIITLKTVH